MPDYVKFKLNLIRLDKKGADFSMRNRIVLRNLLKNIRKLLVKIVRG